LLAAGATHIFKEALIGSAPLAINLHPSLLPRHAGLSPYYWCLHDGDRRGGGTLHRIIPKLDAGPVIDQRAFDLAGVRTVLQVIQKVWDINNAMLIDLYDGKTKEAEAAPQNVAERTYHRNPTRAQVREFRKRGLGFFSTDDVADVIRRVRGI
jgi:methionyl-tRNA formyltransferase